MTNRTTKIKIRKPICEQDLQVVINLIEENIVKYDTKLSWLQTFSDGEILLAEIEGATVGAIIMRKSGKIFTDYPEKYFDLGHINCEKKDYSFIVYLIVEKGFQGKGIGKKLAQEGINFLKKSGTKAIGVHCWQESPGNASQKLFESLGFLPLKMHKAPWREFSKKAGKDNFYCIVCGNPCICDELEMIKYIN